MIVGLGVCNVISKAKFLLSTYSLMQEILSVIPGFCVYKSGDAKWLCMVDQGMVEGC